MQLSYKTERFRVETDVNSYVEDYHRADHFLPFCQECKNYGRRYGCPPFDSDPLSIIKQYDSVRIIGVKLTPDDATLPLSSANELMAPVILAMNQELLQEEKRLHGFACGFVGECPYCDGEPCARREGKPCRHPDKVRPSLEALGFDIGKTAQQLLGIDIKWSHDGHIPEYLTLVCGLFYMSHRDELTSHP